MSLASTAQRVRLMRIARRLGVGCVTMVGDVRQLRAIDAGQPFRQLHMAGMKTTVMDDILHQQFPDLKATVHTVIENATMETLGQLGENLHEVPFEKLGSHAIEVCLRFTPGARAYTAILAPTYALRREINKAVREGLEAECILRIMRLKSRIRILRNDPLSRCPPFPPQPLLPSPPHGHTQA